MTQFNCLKLLFITAFLAFSSTKTIAQTGTINGIITDENGLYVPGANIVISSINRGADSNFDGRFTLMNVPIGSQNITITFIGYEDLTETVTVSDGAVSFLNLTMKPKSTLLNEITISTSIGGQAKALNKQKANANITNIISTDQIGKFPDANIGDAIKRVPGVTMQVDQGEARNVIIRGLSPQLNSVTLNGSRIPSAEGDNRNIQMDLIPSDMIQTIVVNKAVTPDMDADALGGSVNLITRTAPQSFRLSATAGSGVNFINNKRVINGSLLYGDRSNDGRLGWMFSASINDSDFGSDNIEAEWDNEFSYTDNTDEEVDVNVNPYAKEFQQRLYLVQRIRRSFSANFEYEMDNNNTLFFKSMYNWRDDRENRFRRTYEILDGEDISEGDFLIDGNNNLTQFPVEAGRESKGGINNNRNKNRRLEDQRMQNYSLGGDHLFGNIKADWMASFAMASEERLHERYSGFEYDLEDDFGDPIKYLVNYNNDTHFPLFTAVDPTSDNPSNFKYDEVTEENQFTREKDYNIFTNFQLPAALVKDGFIKFGLRTRLKSKYRDNDFYEFDVEDDYESMADTPIKDLTNSDFLAGSQYEAGNFASEEWLGNLALTDGELIYDEFIGGNYNTKEDVYAGYVMTEQQLSNKFSVLAGIRLENTQITSVGNVTNYNEDGDYDKERSSSITTSNEYTNILPSVHLKYNITPNSIIRLAYTNTIARPNYVDLVPYKNILREGEEIEIGNPNLNPATSMNFDLMAEHYFKNVGIISAGAFYKSIKDFAYINISEASDNALGNDTEGYEIKRPLNGDDAYVLGAEFALQRKLDFLPSFAKNFNIYLNYTYLTSEAKGIANEDGDERIDMALPNTAPHMFNGSLGYDDGKFNLRVSANFSDAYIDEIGENEFYDRYYDQQFFLDINAGYAFSKNLRIYVDFTNLTDQPLRYYQGVKERTMQAEYYGQRLALGLKYDLFKK